jgi:hypothetical protein
VRDAIGRPSRAMMAVFGCRYDARALIHIDDVLQAAGFAYAAYPV